jgi:hypothetical protein
MTSNQSNRSAKSPHHSLTLAEKAMRAMQEAADGVVEEAIRTHGCIGVWENGAVRRIFWKELEERRKSGEYAHVDRKPGESPSISPSL